jgi:RHS repeat-associated protein
VDGTEPRSWWYTAKPGDGAQRTPSGQRNPEGEAPGRGEPSAASTPSGTGTGTAAVGGLPSISLPTGGGAIRGIDEKLTVNQAIGTASLTMAVFTSPARQGFGPKVGLSYDSGAGNGPFGLGWSLGVAAITRKTSKGLPRYLDGIDTDTSSGADSDVFMLSGVEDLVPLMDRSGTNASVRKAKRSWAGSTYWVRAYRPRVEAGFARIERWTDISSGDVHWRTISKDNVTSLFGYDASAHSRIADPDNPAHVFSWLLDWSFDDRGNTIRYVYKSEDRAFEGRANVPVTASEAHRVVGANRYLKQILYGNDRPYLPGTDQFSALPTQWCFQLVLDYGEHNLTTPTPAEETTWACRPDPFSSYRSGFEIRTYRLCRRLLMFHTLSELGTAPVLVRSTDLTYQPPAAQPPPSQPPPADPTVPVLSLLATITQTGWITAAGGGYQPPTQLPPVQFGYSPLAIDDTLHTLSGAAADNIAGVFDGTTQRWVDLDGEGLQGILTRDRGAWYYQHNVSAWNPNGDTATARFEPVAVVATTPSTGAATLTDLNGTGNLCAVDFAQPSPGWFEYDADIGWSPLRLLCSTANIDFDDPNLRFVDLNGDGLSDVLITEDDVITWYPWDIDDGFGPAGRVPKGWDEEQGPALVLADGTESIHLADMTGDGLTDLVRVRNGEVCYWPNLGYGRFGAKVSMDNAPLFDHPDLFNERRICFADVDGSGTADIAYLGARPTIWFNQSGNSWTSGHQLTQFPLTPSGDAQASVFDLLGVGTACAVWTSALPDDVTAPLRYVDLTGGVKPYLLTTVTNNLGAQRTLTYAPSTKFYLQDRSRGHPWVTRLPFPVHVVESTRTEDAISRTTYTSRYSYHHGYYDGVEREFRGFGRVETYDTDTLPADSGIGTSAGTFTSEPSTDSTGESFVLPTVWTRTWYHTGAWLEWADIAAYFQKDEYWDGDLQAPSLTGTGLPADASPEELREACRALRGHPLRQEVFSPFDGSDVAANPYSTVEYRYQVTQLQPPTDTAYGSYYGWQRETLGCHYERIADDPRISHNLTLAVDDYGHVTASASVGYPRRQPNNAGFDEQTTTWVSYAQSDYANVDTEPDWYRLGVPVETRSYQLTGAAPAVGSVLFDPDALAATAAGAADIDYDATPSGTAVQRRLLAGHRTLYQADDLTPGPLPTGVVQSLALVWASYTQRYTPGLLTNVFGPKLAAAQGALTTPSQGGLVDLDGYGKLWAPSGQLFYSPDPSNYDPEYAQRHFYQPCGAIDPFGNTATVGYDTHNLVPVQTQDAVGNTASAQINYRVLAPWLTVDPNNNRAGVRYDALGQVTATAVMGKLISGVDEGDQLDTSTPEAAAGDHPTTKLEYNLDVYRQWAADPNRTVDQPAPVWVHTLARVEHQNPNTEWIETYTYTDGLGRVALTKALAEPGAAPQRDTNGVLERDQSGEPAIAPAAQRWVGTGKVVYDNKGNPVKAYEPFFDTTYDYTDETSLVEVGVTAITRYDPLGRVIQVDNPNGTYRTICFDPWQAITADENDTVLGPQGGPPSAWYAARSSNQLGAAELDAATKAAAHANTPTITNLDTLGRVFQTVADNGLDANATPLKYATTITLDIQGRTLATQDALSRTVLTQDYDMTGAEIHHSSVDAGDCWLLTDARGQLLYAWDSRSYTVTATYDALRRPTSLKVDDGSNNPRVAERMVYGETLDTQPGSTVAEDANVRGALYQHYDDAGLATTVLRDFKNNTRTATRQLFTNYNGTGVVTWPGSETSLDPDQTNILPVTNTYDAFNRIVTSTAPDGSTTTPKFNERSLLASVTVTIPATKTTTTVVTSASYNAKGQRETIHYGNGSTTNNTYDPDTFRLTNINTTRPSSSDTVSSQIFTSPTGVQDIQYTYDPVGNITQTTDTALATFIYNNQTARPTNTYTYDPIYRLTSATGREHIASPGAPTQPTWNDLARIQLQPSDIQAMQPYTETYLYDPVGNFDIVSHVAPSPPPNTPPASWTRTYTYDGTHPTLLNNQLTSTTVGNTTENYTYDAAGNMSMPHLSVMQFDFKDQLQATAQTVTNTGTPPTTYYRYDSTGQRVIKATYGQLNTKVAQRVYLGGYELYREYDAQGNVTLERRSLHITDSGNRMCLFETTTIDTAATASVPNTLARYQFGNNLVSTAVELDTTAALISYEEYYPYGATSLQTGTNQAEVSLKRYRYTGKERDTETGYAYHSARYYAPWLGRWVSADPIGLADGTNLYAYVRGNPIGRVDLGGMANSSAGGDPPDESAEGDAVPDPSNWRPIGKGLRQEKVTIDIDEPLPVGGETRLTEAEARARALDPYNRDYRISVDNRVTKHLGVDPRSTGPARSPISVVDNPDALVLRRFSEVTELREIFDEAVGKVTNPDQYSPTALKGKINENIRGIIKTGKSEAASRVREAFGRLGFENIKSTGWAMVKEPSSPAIAQTLADAADASPHIPAAGTATDLEGGAGTIVKQTTEEVGALKAGAEVFGKLAPVVGAFVAAQNVQQDIEEGRAGRAVVDALEGVPVVAEPVLFGDLAYQGGSYLVNNLGPELWRTWTTGISHLYGANYR